MKYIKNYYFYLNIYYLQFLLRMSTKTKMLVKHKSNNLIITPFLSNHTTANSTYKNTIIIKSRNENMSSNDFSDKENSSNNAILKINNNIINLKRRSILHDRNVSGCRNSPFKNLTKKSTLKTNDNSVSKKMYDKSINRVNDSSSFIHSKNNSNFKTKKYNKNNNFKNKNNKNKNGIIIIDKKLNNNSQNNKKTKNKKLSNVDIFFKKDRKKFISKEEKNSDLNKISNSILLNNNKFTKLLSCDYQKYKPNNYISRNINIKVCSSVKTNRANNNQKSSSNSINKTQADKNIYFRKKVDDSSKYLNLQKIVCGNKHNKKYINSSHNIHNNHNYLVNLLIEKEKKSSYNKLNLYSILDKKSIKQLEINSKSTFNSDWKSINSNSNSNPSKNSIQRPFISRNKKYINQIKESPIKGLYTNLIINSSHNSHIKKIQISKNSKEFGLKKLKSMEAKSFQNKNKIKSKNKNKAKNCYNKEDNIKKISLKKRNYNQLIQNSKSTNNSAFKEKDNYFEDLLAISIKGDENNEKDDNDNENVINNIKINNFNIQKPKEENMKFTLLKNKVETESTQEINKSKVIIGKIDGYEDIIESDKMNNKLNLKENTVNLFDYNTIDNPNYKNKKRNLKLNLNNLNLIDETEDNNDGLEIYNFNNNNCFINDSEIKSVLNCMEDEYEFDDMSTTILRNQKNIKLNKKRKLLPFHVNRISYVKVYDNKVNKYIINEKINNDNVLLTDDTEKTLKNDFIKIKKKIINKNSFALNEKMDINAQFFMEKDLLNFNGFNKNQKAKEITVLFNKNINNKNNKKSVKNDPNNIVENCNSFYIEGNDKKCLIF